MNGKIAYAAYGKTTDYRNYQGLPMPEWAALTDLIQQAWSNAAEAVLGTVGAFTATVDRCSSCDGAHGEVTFLKLPGPYTDDTGSIYTFFAPCPATGEILYCRVEE